MEVHAISPTLKLIDLQPPIPGYERFIGAYLFVGEKKAIVDPGPASAVPNLLSALAELNISPGAIDYVILTHIHIDHAGGTGTALRDLPRATVLAHGQALRHLADPGKLWEASLKTLGDLALQYGRIEPVPEDRLAAATNLMTVELGGGLVLEVHLTPGHAAHHLSLFDRKDGVLIAGEAAGVCINGAVRLATPPPFRLDETLSSIDRLIALKPRTLCYGHFGCYGNAVDRLRLARSRLLTWYETAGSAAREGKSPEQILELLREKDASLDYLSRLDEHAYRREHDLLVNTINGLSQSARQDG
ncbi:MAG: MBL fold metallo-hydrolase [Dehalococcoidia bacterium]|nr:MBL fold metallo-hydrolase [Dehalococcoidia bacterium]